MPATTSRHKRFAKPSPSTPIISDGLLHPLSSNHILYQAIVPAGDQLPSSEAPTINLLTKPRELPPAPKPGRKKDPKPAKTSKAESNRNAAEKHRGKKKDALLEEHKRRQEEYELEKRLLIEEARNSLKRRRDDSEEEYEDDPDEQTWN